MHVSYLSPKVSHVLLGYANQFPVNHQECLCHHQPQDDKTHRTYTGIQLFLKVPQIHEQSSISRMSDECLMKQEFGFPFYIVYQAVMRKFTLAS